MIALETQRLNLRDYTKEDWAEVHAYSSLHDFSRFELWGPNSPLDTQKFIENCIRKSLEIPRFHFELAVVLKSENLLIGGCGLRKDELNPKVASMGWAIHPNFQGQGFASEAAETMKIFGFKKLNVQKIYATCDTRNVASYRVMEKIGMQRIQILAGKRNYPNEIADLYEYAITKCADQRLLE